MEITMKDGYELCPYLGEIEKESRRDAEVKNGKRCLENELETDIPEAEPLMARVKAHISRRTERHTKDKWVSLMADYAVELSAADLPDREYVRQYICAVREAAEGFGKKNRHKEKNLRSKRVENTPIDERHGNRKE